MPYFSRTHRSFLPPAFNYYFSAAHVVLLILTFACFYLTQFSGNSKHLFKAWHSLGASKNSTPFPKQSNLLYPEIYPAGQVTSSIIFANN